MHSNSILIPFRQLITPIMKIKNTVQQHRQGHLGKQGLKRKKNQPEKLRKYIFGTVIGHGASATVYRAKNLTNDKVVAIKRVSQELMRQDRYLKKLFSSEAAVLKQCKNPNIVKCYETIATRKNLYIVMEYCNGGDLDNYLQSVGRVPEKQAISFLKQILNGFKGLHQVGVMHRDFKLSNVLLDQGVCKICDLGFAKQDKQQKKYFQTNSFVHSRAVSNTVLGTSVTMAPQVHEGRLYGFQIDIWSIGVCYYQLLYGKYPYDGKTDAQIVYKIRKQKLQFDNEITVSQKSKDFIKQCLTYNPLYRIKWRQIYDHPLINQVKIIIQESENSELESQVSMVNVSDNKRFYAQNILEEKQHGLQDEELSFEGSEYSPTQFFEPKKLYEGNQKQMVHKYKQFLEQQAFGYRFIDKTVKSLYPLNINHSIPCFLLTKLIYLKLKRFITKMQQKSNILLFDEERFQQFIKSEAYGELIKQIVNVKDEIKVSSLEHKAQINRNLCPTLIFKQLDLSKIMCPNYQLLLTDTMFDYERILIEHLCQCPQPYKLKYLELILAIRYFRTKRIANVEEFISAIQSIDMKTMQMQMIVQYY